MFFPLEDVDGILDEDAMNDKIRDIMDDVQEDDPPFLSNLLIHAGDSPAVNQIFELLASGEYSFKWRIKVLRDEWGQPRYPGESIERTIPINRMKRDKELVTPRVLSKAKRDGSYQRKYIRIRKYKIDQKGCFECGFDDAVYFLNNWGYNKKTNTSVTSKPEHSWEPVDMRDPTKGQKKHIRYWRYAEMDRMDYANLKDVPKKQKQG